MFHPGECLLWSHSQGWSSVDGSEAPNPCHHRRQRLPGVNAIRITKGRKPIFIPLKQIRHGVQWYSRYFLIMFCSPHFGLRLCHETFMVYSDILEVLEKADSDGRHLEDKMQKVEEFQGTGKLESVYCCKAHSTCCNSLYPSYPRFVQLYCQLPLFARSKKRLG